MISLHFLLALLAPLLMDCTFAIQKKTLNRQYVNNTIKVVTTGGKSSTPSFKQLQFYSQIPSFSPEGLERAVQLSRESVMTHRNSGSKGTIWFIQFTATAIDFWS